MKHDQKNTEEKNNTSHHLLSVFSFSLITAADVLFNHLQCKPQKIKAASVASLQHTNTATHTWDVPINTFRTLRQTQGATNPQGQGYYESYPSLQKQLLPIRLLTQNHRILSTTVPPWALLKITVPQIAPLNLHALWTDTQFCDWSKQSAIFMVAYCLCSNWITITGMLIKANN